jgi:hypothetical protein
METEVLPVVNPGDEIPETAQQEFSGGKENDAKDS